MATTPQITSPIDEAIIDTLKAQLESGGGNASFELTGVVSFNLGAVTYTKFSVYGGGFGLRLDGLPTATSNSSSASTPQTFTIKNRGGTAVLTGSVGATGDVYLNTSYYIPATGKPYRLNFFQVMVSNRTVVGQGSCSFEQDAP